MREQYHYYSLGSSFEIESEYFAMKKGGFGNGAKLSKK
jgi:hypothetical protein